jgi:hypothetical protein
MSNRDSVANHVAQQVSLQFAEFGTSTVEKRTGGLYYVKHPVIPPIFIELSEAIDSHEPTQPVTMSTPLAYRMPTSETLQAFVIQQQLDEAARMFRFCLRENEFGSAICFLELDFTTCLAEVGSSTWGLALAGMVRYSILRREEIASRFGGEAIT